jgi:hypothetical protein
VIGAGYSEVAREVADSGYQGFNFSKVVKVGQRDSTDRAAAPKAVARA